MLSLLNYGSSDSENESDGEETLQKIETPACSLETLSINLPAPSVHKLDITEENDEFLKKKATPTAVPSKKGKVKIMIPRLSDLKNDDDDVEKELVKKVPTAAKKSGLLSFLPRPSQSFAPAPKPIKPLENNAVQQKYSLLRKPHVVTSSVEPPKKVGLVPYALMSHNPKAQSSSSAKKDESDDEGDSESFFTFDSKIDKLPKVSDEEVRALVAEESKRLELRKRQCDDSLMVSNNYHLSEQAEQQHVENQNFDAEAMKALMGGNRAKRSRVDDIHIIDLSASEVLPNRDEWLRKTLAGETSYIPTGNFVEKGPSVLSKRKHQISYLSMRAESNEAELEAMWASNRQNKRESKSKYGF